MVFATTRRPVATAIQQIFLLAAVVLMFGSAALHAEETNASSLSDFVGESFTK